MRAAVAVTAILSVTLVPAVLAQLYPAEPLDVAYSDLPAACTDVCQAFQEVFLPCQSLADGTIILSPTASNALLAACVCTDPIKDALSACYGCNEDHAPECRLSSTALTTISASALNYDRLCGMSVWQERPGKNISTTTGGGSSLSSAPLPPASLAASTPPSSPSSGSNAAGGNATSAADSSAATTSSSEGGNSSTRVAATSSLLLLVALLFCML